MHCEYYLSHNIGLREIEEFYGALIHKTNLINKKLHPYLYMQTH